MNNWLIPAMIALVLWGIWCFLPKLATDRLDHGSIAVYQLFGAIIAAAIFMIARKGHLAVDAKSIVYAGISGIAGFVGAFFFLMALNKGKASIVIPITGLYPVIAILLSFIVLKEPITLKQLAGMILAIIAIVLMGL